MFLSFYTQCECNECRSAHFTVSLQEDSDTEWKFARSKLYMDYIKSGATLPIPFNMIPSPKSVWKLCSRLGKCFCKSETGDLRPHPGRIKDVELYANSPTATVSFLIIVCNYASP